MQLAMISSPYALRNRTSCDNVAGNLPSSSALRGVGVDMVRMGLDVQEIGEPLRHVAPEMFQELEATAERQRLERDSVANDEAGVTITAVGQGDPDLSGVNFSHGDTVPDDVIIGDNSLPDVNCENSGDIVESLPSGGKELDDDGVEGGLVKEEMALVST